MNFEDRVSAFNDLVQSSLRNAMDSVENIHQTTAEMPLEILKEYGYPEDKAEAAKESHRALLKIMYGGICSANEELGKLVVLQAGGLSQFFNEMTTGTGNQTQPVPKQQTAKKSTARKSTTRKRAKKAAPRKGSG